MSQIAPAKAAPASETRFALYVIAPKSRVAHICLTDELVIVMAVLRKGDFDPGDEPDKLPRLPGVKVTGKADNWDIGNLLREESVTTFVSSEPGTAVFTFKPKNPGTTDINFAARLAPTWWGGQKDDIKIVYATVVVTVEDCDYKVVAIGETRIPGEAQGYIAAASDDAEVKAPDAESPFTGSTTVNWVASVGRVRDCGGAVTIGSSKLDWNGTMSDSGQLTLNGNFQSAAGTFDIECAGGGESFSESMKIELTPDPVSLTVDSSGGVINQSQMLEWEGANPGQITIIVIPVKDQAAVLVPGNHEVSRDDFSSLFGTLLSLP